MSQPAQLPSAHGTHHGPAAQEPQGLCRKGSALLSLPKELQKQPCLSQAGITSQLWLGNVAVAAVPVPVPPMARSGWLSWSGKAVLCTCRDISKAAPENKGVKGEQTSCFEPHGVVHPLERKTEHENTSKRALHQAERSWCGAAVGTRASPGVRAAQSVPTVGITPWAGE